VHWKDDPWMFLLKGSWYPDEMWVRWSSGSLLRLRMLVVSMFVVSNVYVQKDGNW
jgi:hypothetical protein